jgi:hypothetical protein
MTAKINNDHEHLGLYVVEVSVKGHLTKVIIDDFLPCVENAPIYTSNWSGATWMALYEKAMAKVLNGYEWLYKEHGGWMTP